MEKITTQITVSKEQAYVIRDALVLYTRLRLGQFDKLEKYIRYGDIQFNPSKDYTAEEKKEALCVIRFLCEGLAGYLGYDYHSSMSIHNPEVPSSVHISYEISTMLTNVFNRHSRHNGTVHSFPNTDLELKLSTEPIPEISVIVQEYDPENADDGEYRYDYDNDYYFDKSAG
jgi:hypothetical protein